MMRRAVVIHLCSLSLPLSYGSVRLKMSKCTFLIGIRSSRDPHGFSWRHESEGERWREGGREGAGSLITTYNP